MNEEIGRALDAPGVNDRLTAEGFELEKMSPPQVTAFVRAGLERWGPLAKRLMSADDARSDLRRRHFEHLYKPRKRRI